MKQLIDRISVQLKKLQRQHPEAAAAYEIDFSLNKGADEADFAELEKRKPIPYAVFCAVRTGFGRWEICVERGLQTDFAVGIGRIGVGLNG